MKPDLDLTISYTVLVKTQSYYRQFPIYGPGARFRFWQKDWSGEPFRFGRNCHGAWFGFPRLATLDHVEYVLEGSRKLLISIKPATSWRVIDTKKVVFNNTVLAISGPAEFICSICGRLWRQLRSQQNWPTFRLDLTSVCWALFQPRKGNFAPIITFPGEHAHFQYSTEVVTRV